MDSEVIRKSLGAIAGDTPSPKPEAAVITLAVCMIQLVEEIDRLRKLVDAKGDTAT